MACTCRSRSFSSRSLPRWSCWCSGPFACGSRAGIPARRRLLPEAREAIGGHDELMEVAPLEGGVAGVRHDAQIGFRPGAMQLPRGLHGTHDVVSALHDDRGDVADAVDLLDELVVRAQEAAVDEVVTFDARERLGVTILVELRYVIRGGAQVTRGGLPDGPGFRHAFAQPGILARQAPVVGAHH